MGKEFVELVDGAEVRTDGECRGFWLTGEDVL